ncbi:MAG: dimethylmenaquinone methyltransferase [Candidatus Solibacter usitatus]|nr:dimethylmenaquinone methyltransferase [Candidatus Solibacter usitatus]
MRLLGILLFLSLYSSLAPAQIHVFTREQMIRFTAKNPFERFSDGRPKVPDSLIEELRTLSAEDVFGVVPGAGFANQYEGGFRLLHPGRKLVGRAVTAQFMPHRPDVADVAEADAKARGAGRNANQRVIDMLQPGDVIVVDLMGKTEGGTFVGDNLATAIHAATKTGGLVIDGSIRDLEGIFEIPMAAYFRGVHPSAIRNVMLTAVNVPVRIGTATVMPGDVVFGDREGVYFVPPQLVEQVVVKARTTKIHDEWTKAKFMTGKYKSSELYPSPADPALKAEYEAYLKKKLAEKK